MLTYSELNNPIMYTTLKSRVPSSYVTHTKIYLYQHDYVLNLICASTELDVLKLCLYTRTETDMYRKCHVPNLTYPIYNTNNLLVLSLSVQVVSQLVNYPYQGHPNILTVNDMGYLGGPATIVARWVSAGFIAGIIRRPVYWTTDCISNVFYNFVCLVAWKM